MCDNSERQLNSDSMFRDTLLITASEYYAFFIEIGEKLLQTSEIFPGGIKLQYRM